VKITNSDQSPNSYIECKGEDNSDQSHSYIQYICEDNKQWSISYSYIECKGEDNSDQSHNSYIQY
jgi:hypothetical protein